MTTQGQVVIYKDGTPRSVFNWDADGYPRGMGRSAVNFARMVTAGTAELPLALEDYEVDYTYVVNLREDGENTVTVSHYGKRPRTYPLSMDIEEMWADYGKVWSTEEEEKSE